jgi:alkylation response protein AidB-like acyl-CoA dehydrogenase
MTYRKFTEALIAPRAGDFDSEQFIPRTLVTEMANEGLLCSTLPTKYGGGGKDAITHGLLNEEIGACCSSVRCMLTVHDMAAASIMRWGTPRQRERWLPEMASGATLGAFALTEPGVGSDAASIESVAVEREDGYAISGHKIWITSAQIADLFLVFAKLERQNCAFLISRETPGLSIQPIAGMLGVRGSMIGELHFNSCVVPKDRLLGAPGFGFSHVASSALDFGRYTVAWGCVGLARACAAASSSHAHTRYQFGKPLEEHQLIRRLLSDMFVNLDAARLLCCQAGCLRDTGDPLSIHETSVAKYFAARAASQAANDAVQIHGGHGCGPCFPVQRFLRDAKVMEIIEGTNEMHQISLASSAAALA